MRIIKGNTYPVKEKLSKLGFKWCGKKWWCNDDTFNRIDMTEIVKLSNMLDLKFIWVEPPKKPSEIAEIEEEIFRLKFNEERIFKQKKPSPHSKLNVSTIARHNGKISTYDEILEFIRE